MANALPKTVQTKIREAVYRKADDFGYMECGRIDSGKFIDKLVDDPEVGRILIEYLPKERVRTYIKDGLLNAYAKDLTRKALCAFTPEKTISETFNETAHIIHSGKGKQSELFVLRSDSGAIFVVSGGTVIKWETALRKALDVIASMPNLSINGESPSICLKLSLAGQSLTEADKKHIVTALDAVKVKAVFCST